MGDMKHEYHEAPEASQQLEFGDHTVSRLNLP